MIGYINDVPYIEYKEEKNEKGLVIIHNIGEDIFKYDEMSSRIAKLGFDTYLFEYMGHGELKESHEYDLKEKDIEYLLEDLNKVICKKFEGRKKSDIYIYGIDLGSSIAVLLAQKYGYKNLVLENFKKRYDAKDVYLFGLKHIFKKTTDFLGFPSSLDFVKTVFMLEKTALQAANSLKSNTNLTLIYTEDIKEGQEIFDILTHIQDVKVVKSEKNSVALFKQILRKK